MLRVLDLFSGIGGFSLGLERTGGFKTVAFCENQEYPRRVLARRWPNVQVFNDIRELRGSDVGPVDVLCGGFPCQKFSTASRGRRRAADLWGEMHRLVRELRPDWVVAENVVGLGLDGVDRVCADLESSSYAVRALLLDVAPPGRSRGRDRFVFLANADRKREPRRTVDAQVARLPPLSRRRWKDDAAPLGMDDGVSSRMDRLSALGNAFPPEAATLIGRAILRTLGAAR